MKKRKKIAALVLAAVMLSASAEGVLAEEQITEIGTEAVTEAVSESQTEISTETSTESGTEASTEAETGPVSDEQSAEELPGSVDQILEEGIVTAETIADLSEHETQVLPEDMPVVASDGVDYSEVDFLTVSEVQDLSEEGAEHYAELCEAAASSAKDETEGMTAYFAADDDGEPVLTTKMDIQEFFASSPTLVKNGRKQDLYNAVSSSESRKVFNASIKKAKQGKNSFTVSGLLVGSTITTGINAAINANVAWYDWMDMGTGKNLAYKSKYNAASGAYKTTVTILKSKYYSASLEKKAKTKVTKLVKQANAYADANYPDDMDYGIVKYFDNWLCKKNEYNKKTGTDRTKYGATKAYYFSHSSYGCLLKGYGVCESYARAMTRLLDAAGINNYNIIGYAGGGHAWNYVEMQDGCWYMVDSTFNDIGTVSSGRYFCTGEVSGRSATGVYYSSGSGVTYPDLASENYTPVVNEPEPEPEPSENAA